MAKLKPDQDGLRKAAALRPLLYGTAIRTSDLSLEPHRTAILRDCGLVTPEYEMKWAEISRREEPDYEAFDRILAFAGFHDLSCHGHAVWWHGSIPQRLGESSNSTFARAAMGHLEATIRRYAGRLYSWDVVNEPLEPHEGRSDGLRRSRFLAALGSDYISLAFRTAAALDPHAVLVLNEMGLEYRSPDAERKRRMMVALLERELGNGTPIACLGIQSHIDAVEQPREHPPFRAFLREIDRMGLSVMITEMDVCDLRCPRDRKQRDRMVADTYRAYLELVLEESKVLAVSTWGLSDGASWLNAHCPRPDGAPLRPLPLDRALRRKQAWHAIRSALAAA